VSFSVLPSSLRGGTTCLPWAGCLTSPVNSFHGTSRHRNCGFHDNPSYLPIVTTLCIWRLNLSFDILQPNLSQTLLFSSSFRLGQIFIFQVHNPQNGLSLDYSGSSARLSFGLRDSTGRVTSPVQWRQSFHRGIQAKSRSLDEDSSCSWYVYGRD
jgi:hypothetical protein